MNDRGVKCGNCGKYHESVALVRKCHDVGVEAESAAKVMDNLTGQETQINPPSDAQIKFVQDLLAQHVWPDSYTDEALRSMERRQVSRLIKQLQSAPAKKSTPVRQPSPPLPDNEIPPGRYALHFEDAEWKFFQIDKPTEGKWNGRTFVRMLIGSPGDYRQQNIYGDLAVNIIRLIEKRTPRLASIDFGLKSGSCGVCHSPLTNEESLKLGIGPKCRAKMGW